MRVAFVLRRVELYHRERFAMLDRLWRDRGDLQLEVIELASTIEKHPSSEETLKPNVPVHTLGLGEQASMSDLLGKLAPGIVCCYGYHYRGLREASRWARKHQLPTVLMNSTTRADRRRYWWRETAKAWWLRRNFDAAFVTGAESYRYLRGLGFDADRLWRGGNAVDNDRLQNAAAKVRVQAVDDGPPLGSKAQNLGRTGARSVFGECERLRGARGQSDSFESSSFLFVGRLAREKAVDDLLRAYTLHQCRRPDATWDLIVVGSGPEEAALQSLADRLRLRGVHWEGYRPRHELPEYYVRAGALVLPSRSEPWGIVVNEAMAVGLPVLVSDKCGCAADLVYPGVNGYIFSAGDVRALAEAMNRISGTGRRVLHNMGQASRKIIAPYNLAFWARALTDCLCVTATQAS